MQDILVILIAAIFVGVPCVLLGLAIRHFVPWMRSWPRRVTLFASSFKEEYTMPKGEQRSNKMTKKPKKDTSVPQDSSSTSTRPVPPTTVVLPKGKLKNK